MSAVNLGLLNACEIGDVATVRSCLSSGADVNCTDRYADTPLGWAVCNNHPQVVSVLLARHDIDIAADNMTRINALHIACLMGSSDVIPLLGRSIHMTVSLLNTKDCRLGKTALMWAVENGNLSCVKEMAKLEGVDWETKNDEGQTLEDVAKMLNNEESHEEVLTYLQNRKRGILKENALTSNIKTRKMTELAPAPPPAPECPVCLESLAPPVRLYNCPDGHLVCGNCRPRVDNCGLCRKPMQGRATAMEQYLRTQYGVE